MFDDLGNRAGNLRGARASRNREKSTYQGADAPFPRESQGQPDPTGAFVEWSGGKDTLHPLPFLPRKKCAGISV
jgi:hypothetical protein